MNNNLSTQALVYKNRIELVEMLAEAVEYIQDGEQDELHAGLEQIEAVTYVLKNCDYQGRGEE